MTYVKVWIGLIICALACGTAAAADPAGDPNTCSAQVPVPPPSVTTPQNRRDPVSITADQIEFPRQNVLVLKGYTQLVQGGHRVYADELIYNKNEQAVEARGLVKFETPRGDVIKTSVLRYDVPGKRAESGPARFTFAPRDVSVMKKNQNVSAHGTADRVEFEGDKVMYLEGVSITTCADGRDDITFTAKSLKIDMDLGFQVANRAKLQILAPDRHVNFSELLN